MAAAFHNHAALQVCKAGTSWPFASRVPLCVPPLSPFFRALLAHAPNWNKTTLQPGRRVFQIRKK